MGLIGNIWVKLGLKSDDFNKGLDKAERRSRTFGETIKAVAAKVTALVAAFRGVASSVRMINEFEEANSRLAAVLGTTIDKMGALVSSSLELGRKTQYTAREVTGLQTELAKLGFAEPEILSMQESVLKFAAAVGTDLPSAAARAGATMRGFGLTAKETSDMLSVMAVSTSKSALSFNYLDSTLGKLIPVTRAVGLDTRATISLLGTLANAGIDASSAGTALRRVMGEIGNSSSKLVGALGKQPRTMQELTAGLLKLKESGMGVSEAFDMVGKYAAPAFMALVNGADDCRDLYAALQDTDSALDDMYNTMTNNVSGAIRELKSAWEGFVLSMRNSTGVLRVAITELRNTLSDVTYTLFEDARNSTEASKYYDSLSRTIEQTTNKAYALEREYKTIKEELTAKVGKLDKNGLTRFFNSADLKEAKAELAGLEEAYSRIKGEIDGAGNSSRQFIAEVADGTSGIIDLERLLSDEQTRKNQAEKGETEGIINSLRTQIEVKNKLLGMAKDRTELIRLQQELATLREQLAMYEALGKYASAGELPALAGITGRAEPSMKIEIDTSGVKNAVKDLDIFSRKLALTEEDVEKYATEFNAAVQNGFVAALEDLAEAIGTGNWDASTMLKSLLSPFAEACISIGVLVSGAGEAVEGFKKALESLNGWVAIAAGAALVATGVGVKAALAGIAHGSQATGGAGSSNPYTYAGGYGVNPAYVNSVPTQLDINVTGTIKGQDIQLALDSYNNNRRR
ncbi:MAG: phage tail tape measure protein [Bacteroidales bacterium]|nr:phage tail tape measure protein [Bacteroidales bacterium]